MVGLASFDSSQVSVLSAWLRRQHVAPWYPVPGENIAWALCPPVGGSHAFIVFDDKPVGYLRWQIVGRATLDSVGLNELPTNAVDVDLLIGEPQYTGKGVGPAALHILIGRLREDPSLPLVGLTSSIKNVYAHKAFEKAGFHIVRQYAPEGFGLCHLFIHSLHPLNVVEHR